MKGKRSSKRPPNPRRGNYLLIRINFNSFRHAELVSASNVIGVNSMLYPEINSRRRSFGATLISNSQAELDSASSAIGVNFMLYLRFRVTKLFQKNSKLPPVIPPLSIRLRLFLLFKTISSSPFPFLVPGFKIPTSVPSAISVGL